MEQNQFIYYLQNRYGFRYLSEYFPKKSYLNFHYFSGMDISGSKPIFIKMDGTLGQASQREAILLQLLNSSTQTKYFPQLIAYEMEGPYPFVAMELLQGITLEQLLMQGPSLTYNQKRELLRQMLEILTILHKTNVIHRDVRPGNMLIQIDGVGNSVKLFLIDFAFSVGLWPNHLPDLPYLLTQPQYLVDLGGANYKPDQFKWDDAYSFYRSALMIDSNYENLFPELWNQLYSSINKIIYSHQ
ncbi:protein kinase domain-containing protein [Paenibacillus kribbensis]|uniref:protein kinase domain-containing protein n=1 Tax=Paenibacillus kribbensis TaxID=172713 RepID=UPI0015BA615A|nr:protein kinase [Paenibacillus kribbensis]